MPSTHDIPPRRHSGRCCHWSAGWRTHNVVVVLLIIDVARRVERGGLVAIAPLICLGGFRLHSVLADSGGGRAEAHHGDRVEVVIDGGIQRAGVVEKYGTDVVDVPGHPGIRQKLVVVGVDMERRNGIGRIGERRRGRAIDIGRAGYSEADEVRGRRTDRAPRYQPVRYCRNNGRYIPRRLSSSATVCDCASGRCCRRPPGSACHSQAVRRKCYRDNHRS